MSSNVILTFRVPAELKEQLDRLAEATERSRSWLAARALDNFIQDEAWQIAHIKDGIEQLDKGQGVSHERVRPWLSDLAAGRRRRPPK